jgi:hypothetical protein
MIVTDETSAHVDKAAALRLYSQAEFDAAIKAERERCAKICEALIRRRPHVNPSVAWYEAAQSCAAAIRAVDGADALAAIRKG